jgi:hypothetical protein
MYYPVISCRGTVDDRIAEILAELGSEMHQFRECEKYIYTGTCAHVETFFKVSTFVTNWKLAGNWTGSGWQISMRQLILISKFPSNRILDERIVWRFASGRK